MNYKIMSKDGDISFIKAIPHKFELLPNGNIKIECYFDGFRNGSYTTKVFAPNDNVQVKAVVEQYSAVQASDAYYDSGWGNWCPPDYEEKPTGYYEIGTAIYPVSHLVNRIKNYGRFNILWDSNIIEVNKV